MRTFVASPRRVAESRSSGAADRRTPPEPAAAAARNKAAPLRSLIEERAIKMKPGKVARSATADAPAIGLRCRP